MKSSIFSSSTIPLGLGSLLGILLTMCSAPGATDPMRLYWNGNSSLPSPQIWNAKGDSWSTAPNGKGQRTVWQAGAVAVFAEKQKLLVIIDDHLAISGIDSSGPGLELAGGSLSIPPRGLALSTDQEITISCVLQGKGALRKEGRGILTVTTDNTQKGGVVLAGGILRIFSDGALGAGPLKVESTGALNVAAANIRLQNSIEIAPAVRLTIENKTSDLALEGMLTGAGDLLKTGTGSLHLKGSYALEGKLLSDAGETIFSPTSLARLQAVISGGLLRVRRNALATGSSLSIRKAGALAASGACDGIEQWVQSGWIASDSDGILALDLDGEIKEDLNLQTLEQKYPSMALGACADTIVNGAISEGISTLRLGGGGGNLDIRSSLTGDVALVIGRPGSTGTVMLSGENTFTGGISLLGSTLKIGNSKAVPPGEINVGAPETNEYSCQLDLNNYTLSNPIRLFGRATLGNSGGSVGNLNGAIAGGSNEVRFFANAGSLLRVEGQVTTTASITIGSDRPPVEGLTNVVELVPLSANMADRLQVRRGLIFRGKEGLGLPKNARLSLVGGTFESAGEFVRDLVPDKAEFDGRGGVSLGWDSYSGTGFSARGGALQVRLTGTPALMWGAKSDGSSAPGNYKLILNAPTADSKLTFDFPLDLAGNEVDRKQQPTPLHSIVVDAAESVLNQTISNSGSSAAGINKLGGGTLRLQSPNSYNGPTVVSEGTLVFTSPAAIAGQGRNISPAAGTVVAASFPLDNSFLKRISSPNSAPFTLALDADSDHALDFNSETGCFLRAATLGALDTRVYSGKLTPCADVVRLGGGGGRLSVSDPNLAPMIVGGTFSTGEVILPEGSGVAPGFVLSSGKLFLGRDAWQQSSEVKGLSAEMPSSSTPPAPVLTLSSMDRWVDARWDFSGEAPGGFVIETAKKGEPFQQIITAWPTERFLPIFIRDSSKTSDSRENISVRIAAVDGDGRAGPWSNVAEASLGRRHDVESEIKARFPGSGPDRKYNPNDPERLITYTEDQKQGQRRAASNMITQLKAAAANPEGPRHFTIPRGIYRIGVGEILLIDIKDFTIHAPQVEIIVDSEKSGGAFTFRNCQNIKLTGRPENPGEGNSGSFLAFDSEQLNYSLARIVAVNVTDMTMDVNIMTGYDMQLPASERMMAFRPDGSLANIEQMSWSKVEPLGGRTVRLTVPPLRNPLLQNTVLKSGNLLTLHNAEAHRIRTHAVFEASGCRDMTYESIRVFTGAGAPADHGTAGSTVFRDWRLTPRKGTNRLELTSGLGQFSKDGGSFLFEDCEFGPHLDDGINLLSTMAVAARQDSSRSVVICGPSGPKPGATVTFYDYLTWKKLGEAKVVEASDLKEPETSAAVNAYAASFGITQNGRSVWKAKLDRDVTLNPLAMVVYSNYCADEIIVRGCSFRDQVAQILLIQGAKSGLIENNLMVRSTGPAVSLQFAQYWWEGPMPSNLTVRNNVIRDNPVWAPVTGLESAGSIVVWPNTVKPIKERLFSGFRFEGNTIENSGSFGILLRNTRNVSVRFNKIINPGSNKIEERFRGSPLWTTYAAIGLYDVSNATITDNEIILSSPWCQRAVNLDPSCDATSIEVARNNESKIGK